MFQNKIGKALKQKKENKKSNNNKNLKLYKVEEENKEKIEIMKEKINIIREKLSVFKGSMTTKNKKILFNKSKKERKKSIEENPEKLIKKKDLLNAINISPNCQHKKGKEKSLNDSKTYLNYEKNYLNKNNYTIKYKTINNLYFSTRVEKNRKLKNKNNYSMDKDNISLEKNTKLYSLDLYDKFTTKNNKNNCIQCDKQSPNKNNDINNKTNEFSLLNIIKPNKSNSFLNEKTENKEKFDSNQNKENSNQNKYLTLEQLGPKNIANISKGTPSTRNTIKSEIKISEKIGNDKYNKINNKKEKQNNINKKEPINKIINKKENNKNIRIVRCLSKRNIIDTKNKRIKNHSYEYKHNKNLNLNLTHLKSIHVKNKASNNLKKNNKKITNHSINNNRYIKKNPKLNTSEHYITLKTTKNKVPKNIITLRKINMNNKIEIPFDCLNLQKENEKSNKKSKQNKKHSSFNLSKTKINNLEEKIKIKENKIKFHRKIKKEKNTKHNMNKSCENLNVFNYKTIQNDPKEKESKEEIQKVLPHVFSVLLKKNGFKQKEYPNMALRTNSSQGNITIRKNSSPVYKEMKFIKEINYICKKGFAGPGIKKTNQDNFFIFKNFLNNTNYFYVGVCDGHGIFGQDISSYLVNNIPQNLNNDLLNQDIKNILSEKLEKISTYIESSFIQTNTKLNTDERIDSSFSGSTCSSIIFTPKKLISINVGDSRCILGKYSNEKWVPKILTRDHKPNLQDELDRIVASGGRVEPYKDPSGNYVGPKRVWKKEGEVPGLAMSRSFGDEIGHEVGVIVNPEIKEYEFVNEDKFIVLASDGVWEFISNEEVVNIVKDFYLNNDIEASLNYLYKEASKRWIMEEEIIDDITIIIIFLN